MTKKVQEESEKISEELQSAEEEAKRHYEKLLRVMAEFENYKKRTTKELEERTKFANEKLLLSLLPTCDDLDRVLDHIPEEASDEVKKLAEGVDLVRRSLAATFERFGLQEVEAVGKRFNPGEHEAISTVPSDHHEPETVIAVHRKGYRLNERLLRPAMVTVSKK